jgi:hypothetical protein
VRCCCAAMTMACRGNAWGYAPPWRGREAGAAQWVTQEARDRERGRRGDGGHERTWGCATVALCDGRIWGKAV